MKKKLLTVCMTIIMTVSVFPISAFANSNEGTPYPVVGGNIYFREGKIVGSDENITVVNIPPLIGGEIVNWIYDYGFSYSGQLKTVTFPVTMDKIGMAAFYMCSGLEDVTIPSSIVYLDNTAFVLCTNLKTVTMSKSVKHIGFEAFYGCESLTDVYYGGTQEDWNAIYFATYNGETGNEALLNANIHYNCDVPKTFTDPDTGVSVDVFEKEAVSTGELHVNRKTPSELSFEFIKKNSVIYNIGFKSGGVEIQPESEAKVSIPVPEKMNGRNCVVFHLDENGSKTDMNANFEDGYLIFTTDHFSYYLIEEIEGSYKVGDVNDDGQLNAQDKAILNRYLAGWAGYAEKILSMDAADINNDKKVNAQDKAILNRYLAGWSGYDEYFE